jgi:hypothetical protein
VVAVGTSAEFEARRSDAWRSFAEAMMEPHECPECEETCDCDRDGPGCRHLCFEQEDEDAYAAEDGE